MIRFAASLAALLAATPALAQPVAITGGKVVIGDGSAPIEGGTVVVDNGRIVAAGPAGSVRVPAGATTIDAAGQWVTPGLVAGFSRIGLVEVDGGVSGASDAGASGSPYSAAIDVSYSVNPLATPIAVSRADGVTRAIVAPEPEQSVFAGQGAIIDTGADYEPITRARAFQLVYLGESGSGLAGGSRSASALELRDALMEARDGRREGDRPDGDFLLEADIEALRPVVRGEVPMVVAVHRASDILQVLRLRDEFPRLDLVLMGAAEGWRVADAIAAARVPVIAEPTLNRPGSFEMLASTQSNIGRMRAAGVDVGVAVLSDFVTRNARNGRQLAGNLVALQRLPGHTGVTWDDAFAMISSRPAAMVGMDGEIGSLRPGRRADIVLWSGDPLELTSAATRVWIDGVEQDLETRQSRLAKRYRSLAPEGLPKAYRR